VRVGLPIHFSRPSLVDTGQGLLGSFSHCGWCKYVLDVVFIRAISTARFHRVKCWVSCHLSKFHGIHSILLAKCVLLAD